jgi:hypothetical protein
MSDEQSSGVPFGTGYSAEPEPSFTVSAVPVSIPNAETLPAPLTPSLHRNSHWTRRLGTARLTADGRKS